MIEKELVYTNLSGMTLDEIYRFVSFVITQVPNSQVYAETNDFDHITRLTVKEVE